MQNLKLTYNYFTATLTGYNGSQGRTIASAEGCWNSEAEAQAALDAACDKKREAYCDGNGLAYDDEIVDDRFRGWLGDYQRTAVSFEVVPSVDGRLVHELRRSLSPDELPEWSDAEVASALGLAEDEIEVETIEK
jgi:hypothetical protein